MDEPVRSMLNIWPVAVRRCCRCAWFSERGLQEDLRTHRDGLCKARAPVVLETAHDVPQRQTVWPTVNGQDWCGAWVEWKKAESS